MRTIAIALAATIAAATPVAAAGGKVDTFELPKMGIKGNTHMMMMDRNSDDVANLINEWIEKQGLAN
ncbi:hypothetical protein QCM77_31770 [Bradyrhizobium sp. SSUT18]|uniref:hypothetical protein n=1 Tax=unclassified Bradyrhizobium TaxID=2631580 RepID=UPI002448B799|nr:MULTISPECIES: hypothetical protein [unclassified Bradyrhizobium]MDH2340956.1 hypothetical protein [Bradyrhizobium sp. SSUT77]MDH2354753.1 hypothetical protein [Bradyrhizobium sp. SSUT112]MDH2404496.1 hypothetical protein [Bradyrhizobium sp. SSUT18]